MRISFGIFSFLTLVLCVLIFFGCASCDKNIANDTFGLMYNTSFAKYGIIKDDIVFNDLTVSSLFSRSLFETLGKPNETAAGGQFWFFNGFELVVTGWDDVAESFTYLGSWGSILFTDLNLPAFPSRAFHTNMTPVDVISIAGYPLEFHLYGDDWKSLAPHLNALMSYRVELEVTYYLEFWFESGADSSNNLRLIAIRWNHY